MNRSYRWLLMALLAATCGCHHEATPPISSEPPLTEPTGSHYFVVGGVQHPGARSLHYGDTISTALKRNWPAGKIDRPVTILLTRSGPEGKTRQFIQVDAQGKPIDPKQDFELRNDDELTLPGAELTPTTTHGVKSPDMPPH